MHKWYHSKVVQEMMFSNPIVFDMSYDQYMQKSEIMNLAEQMAEMWTLNRSHVWPSPVTFCNVSPDSEFSKFLLKTNPRINDLDYPVEISSKHYLDLYPKNQVVYLTPDSRQELQYFNHDDVYIVGGIVDKTIQEPLSYAKANKEGLRTARFPLEKYLPYVSFLSDCIYSVLA